MAFFLHILRQGRTEHCYTVSDYFIRKTSPTSNSSTAAASLSEEQYRNSRRLYTWWSLGIGLSGHVSTAGQAVFGAGHDCFDGWISDLSDG